MNPAKLIGMHFDLLVRQSGKKKGELEVACGVTAGYFSKLKKSTVNLNLNTAYRLSQLLDISLDDLCSKQFYLNLLTKDFEERIKTEQKELEERKAQIIKDMENV